MQMKTTINYHLIAAEGASLVTQTVWNLLAMCETQVQSLGREEFCRREWLRTTVFLPGEIHGQRSLVGSCPLSHKESDTTEWLTTRFSECPRSQCPEAAGTFSPGRKRGSGKPTFCNPKLMMDKKKRPVKNTAMVQVYNWVYKVSRFPTNRHSMER